MSTHSSHRKQRRNHPYLTIPDDDDSSSVYHTITQPISPPLSSRSLSVPSIKESIIINNNNNNNNSKYSRIEGNNQKKERTRRNVGNQSTSEKYIHTTKTGRMGYDVPTQTYRRLPLSLQGKQACDGIPLREDFTLGDLEAAMCLRYLARDTELMAEGHAEEELVDLKDDLKAKRKNGIVRTLQKGRCENCGMDETGAIMWRSDKMFEQDFGLRRRLCNRCGLYKQTNSIDRPILQPWAQIPFRPLPTDLTTFHNDDDTISHVQKPLEETMLEFDENNAGIHHAPTTDDDEDERITQRKPLAVVFTAQNPSSRPRHRVSVDAKHNNLSALGLARLDDVDAQPSQSHMWASGSHHGYVENNNSYIWIHEKPQYPPARSRMYGQAKANSRSSGPYVSFGESVSQLVCDTNAVDSSGMLITPPYSCHILSPRHENFTCLF